MIESRQTFLRLAGFAVALWTLSACVAPVPPPPSNPFPAEDANRTIAAGYMQISERYIDALPLSEIALAATSGLDTIDPTLTVKRQGNDITLWRGSRKVRTITAPSDKDTHGWARVTVDLTLAGRDVSPELREAPLARIYEAVFDGATSRLDRFSRYTGADAAAEQRARRRGFGGIGIEYRWTASGAVITSIIPDSPAERSAILAGDVVTVVNGEPIKGRSEKEFREMLHGAINEPVSIGVRRGKSKRALTFNLTRERIYIPTVKMHTVDGIIVAHITGFNSHTTKQLSEFYRAAEEKSVKPIRGVILDLRDNPGGLLRQAVYVADLFLRQGEIVSTRGRHPDSFHDYSAHQTDLAAGLPIVVLVNGRSASSAEIVAAALQDHNRAVVIGSTSYGKGTVQTVVRLPNDGELTLTWSRFVTPSGYFLHGLGIEPTVCTDGPGDARAMITDALDHEEEAAHVIAEWRSVPLGDHADRQRLREVCPSSASSPKVDIDVAKMLIDRRDLYHRVATGPLSIASTDR